MGTRVLLALKKIRHTVSHISYVDAYINNYSQLQRTTGNPCKMGSPSDSFSDDEGMDYEYDDSLCSSTEVGGHNLTTSS